MTLTTIERERIAYWLNQVAGYSVQNSLDRPANQLWAIKCSVERRLGREMPKDFRVPRNLDIYSVEHPSPKSKVEQLCLF